MTSNTTAVQPSRYDILDALRGFALFGICLANVPFFGSWMLVDSAAKSSIYGAQLYDSLLLLLIDGRFYTIFSFLFGLGFSLQLSRLVLKDSASAKARYLRRIGILLLIGMFHNFIIWLGDILLLYAVLGLVLFALRNLSDKSLLSLAMIMFIVPIPGYLLFWYAGIDPDLGFYEIAGQMLSGNPEVGSFFAGYAESLTTTDFGRFLELSPSLGMARIGYYFDTWRIPKVLAVMLVGMWAGRQLVQGTLLENTKLLKKTILLGLCIGIPFSFYYMYLSGLNSFSAHSFEGFMSVVAYTFAVFPTGFAYAAMFTLLWLKSSSLLNYFAAPGRMALTNYLSQTAISIIIFYGIGFGLGTNTAPGSYILVTLIIFSLQVMVSNVWLSHFKYGPAEWIWRCLTYGKLLPIKN